MFRNCRKVGISTTLLRLTCIPSTYINAFNPLSLIFNPYQYMIDLQ